jgi:hypothetical protein
MGWLQIKADIIRFIVVEKKLSTYIFILERGGA